MDAAFEKMFTLLQTCNFYVAALKEPGPGYRHVRKAAGAFGNRGLSVVKSIDEPTTKLGDFGKGMRLPTLVNDAQSCSLLDMEGIRFKIPASIGGSGGRLRK